MKIVTKIADFPHESALRTALVPTMGAFHEGHLQLMRNARKFADRVVVSLFVNPIQFGPNEDYTRYPRVLDKDAALAESVGVDVLFAPSAQEMYPRESTRVVVPEVTEFYEGSLRPGHFDGVATVVCKLFGIVRPHVALFGWKDLQQCSVIRRMVEDLCLPVELEFCETTREADGLALSSRNAYLSQAERSTAPTLQRELQLAMAAIQALPKLDGTSEAKILALHRENITKAGFVVDYLDLIDLERFRPAQSGDSSLALAVAAKLGKTRLIDNVRFTRE